MHMYFPILIMGSNYTGQHVRPILSAKIQVAQNLLLKTLAKHIHLDSATALQQELNILKVHELFTLYVLIFVYKQCRNQFPGLFHQFLLYI